MCVCVSLMPKALPVFSVGELPGRGKAEGGNEENDEEDDVRQVEKEVTNAALTTDLVDSTTIGAPAGR